MSSLPHDRWRALLDELEAHSRVQDDRYRAEARRLASPCLSGCHGCCHRLVLVDLADALGIARHLLDRGAATAALRDALTRDAARAERLSPDEVFAEGAGCVFLDRTSPGAACSIYDVRPQDCRTWFIHGVEDGSWCGPGAPERELAHLQLPDLEEADVRLRTRLRERLPGPPVWVPLALGVLAALDLLERGPLALETWRPRLDAATQRSFELVDGP